MSWPNCSFGDVIFGAAGRFCACGAADSAATVSATSATAFWNMRTSRKRSRGSYRGSARRTKRFHPTRGTARARSAADDGAVLAQPCGDELPLRRVDSEGAALRVEEIRRGVGRLHQPAARVLLRREQVMAELVRERAAHGAGQIDFTFEHRHLAGDANNEV